MELSRMASAWVYSSITLSLGMTLLGAHTFLTCEVGTVASLSEMPSLLPWRAHE